MQHRAETVFPYDRKENKGRQVEQMFNSIAGTYDRLNHTLSLCLDYGWRKKCIRKLLPFSPSCILDLATGTGDMAIMMCRMIKPQHITATDISEKMMDIAREKAETAGFGNMITFERQDCMALSFPEATFDAVTIAFGIRNFEDTEKGLAEMYRVLKSDGQLAILELSTPRYFPFKQIYNIYSGMVIPFLGRLISSEKNAYRYLPASIKAVTQGHEMQMALSRQGFEDIRIHSFSFGVCSLYMAKKK
jgi:demethylmenaquinone methyltransferase/2-methoxy-6-polyprenyl-1,4-benzoquinol methylase